MKTKHKNLLFFLVFLTILMISVPSLYTTESQEGVDIFNLGNSQVSWNVSEYVEFTGPPIDAGISPPSYLLFRIYVDDYDPNYNWSKTEAENAWCSGSGIPGDPYIIEGLYIDAQGVGGGIYIKNSVKHFIIRDCWVNNSGTNSYHAGVLIKFSENGIIENNIFTYTRKGVWIEFYCENITVSGNYMVSDPILYARAIDCDWNNDIIISGNVIVNFYDGMYIYDFTTNCTLSSNYIANFIFEEWPDAPVRFFRANHSKAIYNTLDGVYAQRGVFVDVIGGGDNIVTNNTVVSAESMDVPEIPILSSNPKLHAPERSLVNLQDSHFNLIAHNRILSRGSDEGIPGYDTLLILSLAGIMITILVIKISFKKFKR